MFNPVGFGVLVLPDPLEDNLNQEEDSIIVIPDTVKDSQRIETTIGVVLAYGKCAWRDLVKGEPWCNVGDRILFAKHGGKIFQDPETNEDRILIQDRDVLGIMEEGKNVRT